VTRNGIVTMAMTGAERSQRFRDREKARTAPGAPWLFPELVPPAPPAAPPPKTTEAQRKASKESSKRHRDRKAKQSGKLAPIGDPDRPDVDGLIAWLAKNLKVSQGRRTGEAFSILPWQAEFLDGALAPRVFDAALSMARGNGKSTFAAAVMVAALVGPLRQPRGEVLLVASSFAQARIVYEHVLAFVQPWIEARALDWKIEDSSQRASITHKPSGARVRCIGSDPKRAHGLAPAFCVLDEPSQWPENTGAKMLAAIETAAGKVPGSRRWLIGTKHDDTEHFFSKALRAGADFSMVFSGDVEHWDEPDEWAAANPSLQWMPDLRLVMESECAKAKADPDRLASFKALRLNGGVADVQHRQLLEADVWARIESEDAERTGEYALGVDLGGGAAMTAFAGFWIETGRLEALASFPGEPGLKVRGKMDGVADLYQRMAERGELLQTGKHAVDIVETLKIVRDRWGLPSCLIADRWKERDLREALHRANWPRMPLILRGQGFKDGGEDVANFRRAVLEGHVSPPKNLLLRAAMRESRTLADPARNEKLAKQTQGGRRARARDDAAAAAILAVAEGYRETMRRSGAGR